MLKVSRTSNRTRPTISIETLSDDEDEYLETCPIYHDVDSQSIYGFDVIQHPLRKSEEILWKDCEFNDELCDCIITVIFAFLVDYKFQPPLRNSPTKQLYPVNVVRQRSGSVDQSHDVTPEFNSIRKKRWFESDSITSINLASSLKIFHEDEKPMTRNTSRLKMFDNDHGFLTRKASMLKLNLLQRRNTVAYVLVHKNLLQFTISSVFSTIPEKDLPKNLPEIESIVSQPRRRWCQGMRDGWSRFVRVFDLGLLSDKIYLNMMIGIAIAVFAEINFSLLTPFILDEFNYSTEQIAVFMSTLAVVDIFCRFASPFIGDYFKQPPRVMYMYALLMLIITRTSLLFARSYNGILYVAMGLGLAKGVRSVYMSLVVPSYIPLERLAAASGIQMVTNGIIILSMGSFVGEYLKLSSHLTSTNLTFIT